MAKTNIKNAALSTDELVAYSPAGAAITGLGDGDWVKRLYNPSGSEVSGSVAVTVTELGNGAYRSTWTPNALGAWVLLLTNVANDLAFSANYDSVEGTIGEVWLDTDSMVTDLATVKSDAEAAADGVMAKLEITSAGGGTLKQYKRDDTLLQEFELYDSVAARTTDPGSVTRRERV